MGDLWDLDFSDMYSSPLITSVLNSLQKREILRILQLG